MKIEPYPNTYMDLTYELPQPGISVLVIEEGIQKRTNEKSGKTTLQIPCTIVEVLQGDKENVGKKLTHFCPIETEFGEKQVLLILTSTGLVSGVSEKFGDSVDVMDDTFINYLKLKLPGKKMKGIHVIEKDQSGKDRTSITRLESVNGSPFSSKGEGKGKKPAGKPADTGEGW